WLLLGQSLGVTPTPMAMPEIYLAMKTGSIDGQENPLTIMNAAKFYEVSKQVVLTGHMVANVFFTLSNGFWDDLSDDERKAVEAAEVVAKTHNDDGVIATEKDAAGFFESKGVAVTTPDVAAFRDQVQKKFLESEFAKTWPEGMLDRINKAGA
ncbi:MAG: TRAP transporter substrate-binding protein DctP, partial [Dongiaceae bacterium]